MNYAYTDLEAIHELPGVQTGMIAQEVEEVFPGRVDEDGLKRIALRGFEAGSVEVLRELGAQKDRKVALLQPRNAAPGARLEAALPGR